jgi:hypothetical protein
MILSLFVLWQQKKSNFFWDFLIVYYYKNKLPHVVGIGLFVPCRGTFCAVPWLILCLPMAHKSKSLFVPCCGTFCAFPWHIKSKSLFVPCCGTFCAFLWRMVLCSLLSRITSQELQVKNCKSRIASQELQKKSFRQFGHFFSRLNE